MIITYYCTWFLLEMASILSNNYFETSDGKLDFDFFKGVEGDLPSTGILGDIGLSMKSFDFCHLLIAHTVFFLSFVAR